MPLSAVRLCSGCMHARASMFNRSSGFCCEGLNVIPLCEPGMRGMSMTAITLRRTRYVLLRRWVARRLCAISGCVAVPPGARVRIPS